MVSLTIIFSTVQIQGGNAFGAKNLPTNAAYKDLATYTSLIIATTNVLKSATITENAAIQTFNSVISADSTFVKAVSAIGSDNSTNALINATGALYAQIPTFKAVNPAIASYKRAYTDVVLGNTKLKAFDTTSFIALLTDPTLKTVSAIATNRKSSTAYRAALASYNNSYSAYRAAYAALTASLTEFKIAASKFLGSTSK